MHWCGRKVELNGGVGVRKVLQPPFQCLYLLRMRKGKQKGPGPSWLLAMAGTDRLRDDALRIFKIAPSQRLWKQALQKVTLKRLLPFWFSLLCVGRGVGHLWCYVLLVWLSSLYWNLCACSKCADKLLLVFCFAVLFQSMAFWVFCTKKELAFCYRKSYSMRLFKNRHWRIHRIVKQIYIIPCPFFCIECVWIVAWNLFYT